MEHLARKRNRTACLFVLKIGVTSVTVYISVASVRNTLLTPRLRLRVPAIAKITEIFRVSIQDGGVNYFRLSCCITVAILIGIHVSATGRGVSFLGVAPIQGSNYHSRMDKKTTSIIVIHIVIIMGEASGVSI